MSAHGEVLEVEDLNLQSAVLSNSSTTIYLEDASGFPTGSGQGSVFDSETGSTVNVTWDSVDYDNDALISDTGGFPGLVPYAVLTYLPVYTTRVAWVQLDDPELPPVAARVPFTMTPMIPLGMRSNALAEGDTTTRTPEEVLIDQIRDVWYVVDILGQSATIDTSFISGSIDISDGTPPGGFTTPTVLGGPGFFYLKWLPVDNPDAVVYDVFVSPVSGFVADDTTLVGSVAATSMFVKGLPDGSPFAYGTTYYFCVIARDLDGSGPQGPEASGQLVQVTGPDIAAATIVAFSAIISQAAIGDAQIGTLDVGKLIGQEINGQFQISGKLYSPSVALGNIPADGVQGLVFDSNGLRLYDSTGTLVVNFPASGTGNALYKGDVDTTSLRVRGGYKYQDPAGIADVNSSLTLTAGVQPPGAPIVTRSWPTSQMPMQLTVQTQSGPQLRSVAQWDAINYDSQGSSTGTRATFFGLAYLNSNITYTNGADYQQPLYIVEVDASTLQVVRMSEPIDYRLDQLNLSIKGGASNFTDIGITRCNGYYYVALFYTSTTGVHRLQVLNYSQFAMGYAARSEITSDIPNGGYEAWITRNKEANTGSTPVVIFHTSGNFPRLKTYFTTSDGSLAGVNTTLSLDTQRGTAYESWGAIFDGTFWWFLWGDANGNNGSIWRFDGTGTYSGSDHDFIDGTGKVFGGMTYNPATSTFYTCTSALLVSYSTYEWLATASSAGTWWFATSWVNNSLETTVGRRVPMVMPNRAYASVVLGGAYPTGGTGAWTSRIYVTFNTTGIDPDASTFAHMQRQTTLTDPTSRVLLASYSSTGTADPTTNGLASTGTPAILQTTGGSGLLAGDGQLLVPQFASTGRYANPVEGQLTWDTVAHRLIVYDGGRWLPSELSLRGAVVSRSDFMEPTSNNLVDGLGVNTTGAGNINAAVVNSQSHPGVWNFNTGTAAGGGARLAGATSSLLLGGGRWRTGWWIKTPSSLSISTTNYYLFFGFSDNADPTAVTNGVFIEYNNAVNSGNWTGVTTKAGSGTTSTNLSGAGAVATSTWYLLEVDVNSGGTSVGFFINGINRANVSTNIPVVALELRGGILNISNSAALGRTLQIDAYYLYGDLAVSR